MVVMLAMGIPITCVILAVKLPNRAAATAEPIATPAADPQALDGLRSSLEKAASQGLEPGNLSSGKLSITISSKDLATEQQKIEKIVQSFQASAFISQQDETKITMLAQVPGEKLPLFLAACGQPAAGAGQISSASELVEILLVKVP